MKKVWFVSLFLFSVVASARMEILPAEIAQKSYFYSVSGREHIVQFRSVYRTEYKTLEEVSSLTASARQALVNGPMTQLMDFLFGPLVTRSLGSPKRVESIQVDWNSARLVQGKVELTYDYRATWIIGHEISASGKLSIPVPRNRSLMFSPNWKSCGDSNPEHQTAGFYWYFWDPSRHGCDHQEGTHFQTVQIALGQQTPNTVETFPEYGRMIQAGAMRMTLAFGYVEEGFNANPEIDSDLGAREYQKFLREFRKQWGSAFKESPIYQGEYRTSSNPQLIIGHRFQGRLHGVETIVNVVIAAGVDQMEIFAKSFAHDHDALFAWYGHSRVGSGFDAERFHWMVKTDPDYYSISDRYQVIYWAGCNSYSYYTIPFFAFKGGSKNLDIIANGLSSLFVLNADNAMITVNAFLNWQNRASYQSIVRSLEFRAVLSGIRVLVAVLGDEDNP